MKAESFPQILQPELHSIESEFLWQVGIFHRRMVPNSLLAAIPQPVVVLNDLRQIVYANEAFVRFVGATDEKEFLGLRPGEAMGCIRDHESVSGCGTTEFCKTCGTHKAILESRQRGQVVQECRISRKENLGSFDLRVTGAPLAVEGQLFTIFTAVDISNEKRRAALERIFFHDVLNTAGGISGFLEIMQEAPEDEKNGLAILLKQLVDRLVNEIRSQREIHAAERHEIAVRPGCLVSRSILQEVIDTLSCHEVGREKRMRLDETSDQAEFVSDRALLMRVLGNLAKNALEASKPGATVTLSTSLGTETMVFSVHNSGTIPHDTQLQIFQRSFSTKGPGRGLGTYSVKLLTEQYLNGRVGFSSNDREGTTFSIILPRYLEVAEAEPIAVERAA